MLLINGDSSISNNPQPIANFDSYGSVAISSVTGANQQLIAAPGANKQIWVYGIQITVTAAGTVALQDSDDTPLTGAMSLSSGIALISTIPLYKVATNKALEADVVTATINGSIQYAIVSV